MFVIVSVHAIKPVRLLCFVQCSASPYTLVCFVLFELFAADCNNVAKGHCLICLLVIEKLLLLLMLLLLPVAACVHSLCSGTGTHRDTIDSR